MGGILVLLGLGGIIYVIAKVGEESARQKRLNDKICKNIQEAKNLYGWKW